MSVCVCTPARVMPAIASVRLSVAPGARLPAQSGSTPSQLFTTPAWSFWYVVTPRGVLM